MYIRYHFYWGVLFQRGIPQLTMASLRPTQIVDLDDDWYPQLRKTPFYWLSLKH